MRGYGLPGQVLNRNRPPHLDHERDPGDAGLSSMIALPIYDGAAVRSIVSLYF